MNKNGAQSLIQTMINNGVEYVFGLPGAKIDMLFDQLENGNIPNAPKLIITRHEQNAAFMAAGVGRITGKPGVAAVTSGPGVANLATGLVTATSEGDPMVAIGGQVQRDDVWRLTHQSIANTQLLSSVTKSSVEVEDSNNLSEAFANSYQVARQPKQGATFISVPQDVMNGEVQRPEVKKVPEIPQGVPDKSLLESVVKKIKNSKMPVILAGMRASDDETTQAIRRFLQKVNIPLVETFQGAGVISRDLEDNFFGRVGLFRNQTGDILLSESDLVITIGYDPVEYEARNWNKEQNGEIVHIDNVIPELSQDYQPDIVLEGNIAKTLDAFVEEFEIKYDLSPDVTEYVNNLRIEHRAQDEAPRNIQDDLVHPLTIISELQKRVDDDTTVTVDVGSVYIWMARHFRSYEPRKLLFSNGMQTLGVALPWAISAALVQHNDKKVVSISGDGGFLFSGQELATAVQNKLNIVHLIWNDGYYDMVKFQEQNKYGRDAGVDLGKVDFKKYAESFGATGLKVDNDHDIASVLDEAFMTEGPVVVDIPVDYSDNNKLSNDMLEETFN